MCLFISAHLFPVVSLVTLSAPCTLSWALFSLLRPHFPHLGLEFCLIAAMLMSWERTDADAPCRSRDFMSVTVASLGLAMFIVLLSFHLSSCPKRTSCIFRSWVSIVAQLNLPSVRLHWINIYGLLFCNWPWTNLHFHHQPVWNLAVGTFQSEIWLMFKICHRLVKNHVRFCFLISGQVKRVKDFSAFFANPE